MRLYLLSLLLAIASVQSLTIGYPYRSALLGYSPARGEFPVQSSVVQGYLRYLDSNGVERLVGYSYPEPVYGVRQLSYVSGVPGVSAPVFTTYKPEESSDFAKAREAHFRAYSLQQYQALKREIDALRAAGKEPSIDLLAKFQPLERIALTSDYSSIAELPEVKRVRDEHLTLFNDARIQDLQADTGHLARGEIKTYTGHNVPLVPVEETPEQKLARQEHLRIYKEQLERVQLLQKQEREDKIPMASSTPQTTIGEEPLNRLASQSDGLTEVERATREHLRLWNEAKLRAEKASEEQHEVAPKSESNSYDEVVPEGKKEIQQIQDLRTVSQKAHDEHLRLVNEATAKIHNADGDSAQAKVVVPSESSQVSHLRYPSPVEQVEIRHVVSDTPEVVKAREEHLRLVNEARVRAESVEQAELEHKHVVQIPVLKSHQPQISPVSQAIPDTAEVKKAREEHLRLVHDAQVKARTVEQQSRTESHPIPIQQSQVLTLPQIPDTPEVLKAREEHLRLVNEVKSKSVGPLSDPLPQNVLPQETPEVIQAREEHLRIFQAVKAYAEQEQAKSQAVSENFQKPLVGIQLRSQLNPEDADGILSNEEQIQLDLERKREEERLLEDQKQLEMERIREAQRLAEEQRLMEAELMRLKQEEYDRLLNELLAERRRLRADLEQLQQMTSADEYKPAPQEETIIIEEGNPKPQQFIESETNPQKDSVNAIPKSVDITGQVVQPSQQYDVKPDNVVVQGQVVQQQYVDNPFLKSIPIEGPVAEPQIQPVQHNEKQLQAIVQQAATQPETTHQSLAPGGRHIQPSQEPLGSKHQHIKDNSLKMPTSDNVSYQPADTAAALIHLEKARQEHFRAHEQALEQLRLARVQNPLLKDCNH